MEGLSFGLGTKEVKCIVLKLFPAFLLVEQFSSGPRLGRAGGQLCQCKYWRVMRPGDQNIRVKCDKCQHESLSVSDPLKSNDDGNGGDIDCRDGNGVDNENDDWHNTILILPPPLCSILNDLRYMSHFIPTSMISALSLMSTILINCFAINNFRLSSNIFAIL